MTLLLTGLLIFFGIHLIPNIGNTREQVINAITQNGYMAVYSLLSLLGMVLLVMGKGQAEIVEVWQPPVWTKHITYGLMLLSIYCSIAIIMATNLKRWIQHPMLAYVALWGLAHLVTNGDLASILLFGSFAVFAVYKTFSLMRRKPKPRPAPVSIGQDVLVAVIALVSFAAFVYLHPHFSGGFALL